MLYLILHKVRGEPAFDIAEKRCEGPEPCQPDCGLFPGCKTEEEWIIPTSGHRAYPSWTCPLDQIILHGLPLMSKQEILDTMKPEWPDHYACNDKPIKGASINVMALVSNLFPKIKRRF